MCAVPSSNSMRLLVRVLAALDIEFQIALETSADTSAIVAKKQVLRDYPAHAGITTAQNAQDLKADWDTAILGDKPKGY